MRCPKCKNLDTKVIDSRMTEDGQSIRRRRECEKCEARFTTFERLEFINFLVTKSTGEKDLYDRTKVQRSILMAFNKRSMDHNKIEQMINELENEWASNKKGITSKRI
jgi:transcriptional repressor NrdR